MTNLDLSLSTTKGPIGWSLCTVSIKFDQPSSWKSENEKKMTNVMLILSTVWIKTHWVIIVRNLNSQSGSDSCEFL